MKKVDYKSAGVDIAAGNEAVRRIKKSVESTFSPHVLTGIGSFASLYNLREIMANYQNPVLVQSIDGVGTKIIVARMAQQFDKIGEDLVSAVTNDIIVLGAKPLTLLDYIANDKLQPSIIEQIISGMVKACCENHISLVGGETAEMPGTYLPGEHDLVGVITGVVEKDKAILGKTIKQGDVVLGFASSGLHTNGYSLARKLFFDVAKMKVDALLPEAHCTLAELLLAPHINYTLPVLHMLKENITIKGMAHITGGGFLENIPRILPEGCAVDIQLGTWPSQPIFSVMQDLGHLTDEEMYRTFNMGIGLILVMPPAMVAVARAALMPFPAVKLYEIGQVVTGNRQVRLL